jgi:hypothetical protein
MHSTQSSTSYRCNERGITWEQCQRLHKHLQISDHSVMAVPDSSDTEPTRSERAGESGLESGVDFEDLQWLLARDESEMPRREPAAQATLQHSSRHVYSCRGEQFILCAFPLGLVCAEGVECCQVGETADASSRASDAEAPGALTMMQPIGSAWWCVGEALRPQGVCSQGTPAVRSLETWMAAWKAVGMLW